MLIRREDPSDIDTIRAVTAAAFARDGQTGPPVEAPLVDALRADEGWLPALSLVVDDGGEVVGHVVCTRGWLGEAPALGLGPLSVRPDRQGRGVGKALVHSVLGAADALGEPLVALLGSPDYYGRFGFRPSHEYGVVPPVPEWGAHFQVRALSAYDPALRGAFRYSRPFDDL